MAIEFELKIKEVRKIISIPATEDNNYENDLSDVIIKIHYSYKGDKEGYTCKVPGEINLEYPSATDDFISIDNITEEIILGWINDVEDFTQLQVFIENEIDKLITPTETAAYFDWLPDPFTIEESPVVEEPSPIETDESSGE